MPGGDALRGAQVEGSLIVAACGGRRGIGKGGTLPWPKLSADLRHFKAVTLGGAVVMGSRTYLSLPASVRPLPGRLNVVLSSQSRAQLQAPDDVLIAGSLDAAAALLLARDVRKAFVIGGESVYRAALEDPHWSTRVYYTQIETEFDADRFFPLDLHAKDSGFALIAQSATLTEKGATFRMCEFARTAFLGPVPPPAPVSMSAAPRRHAEHQYLDLVRRILRGGVARGDRTGTGTLSVFGAQMRFDLRESFPLLTTKRVFWRGVVEELLWFIRGSTNANELSAKGVHIWDGNGSREYLDRCGFHDRDVGDLGPVYGFQWRHFGAEYTDMHADYAGKGVDQLAQVIDTIKTRPNDRRILLSAWNPAAIPRMALPPCHVLAQFYVGDGELSCMMYQRSCDMGLGVPFNIASYALLTCLVANVCGLRPGEFVHSLGDAHVYTNHVEALEVQLQREPRKFPTVEIRPRENIEEFCMEDIVLQDYEPHKAIAMKMAV